MLKRAGAYICILITAIPLLCGCTSQERKSASGTFFMFETIVKVTLYGTEDEAMIEECRSFLNAYEDVFSATRSTSELYRLNNSDLTKIEISKDLYDTIDRSLEMCEMTEGRFDITVRPVSELWMFTSEDFCPPSAKEIEEKIGAVSYKNISVTEENGKYYFNRKNNEIMLDLGAVSKGYISDRLKEYILSLGIESAVIDLGGNIMCVGGKNDGTDVKDFTIGIYDPVDSKGQDPVLVNVRDCAVISSGVYQRSAQFEGKTYHHILDARTGMPAEGELESVSVICQEGLMGDMYSTGLFLLGEEGIVPVLPADVGVLYIYKDGTRRFEGDIENKLTR